MANEEHLRILRGGVKDWNWWRQRNLRIIPYLSAADLSEANLKGADLGKANLKGANLKGANLKGADLSGTDLSETNLKGADLSGADINEANLYKAILSETYLVGTNLRDANLSAADISSAKLFRANLSGVNLSGANLSAADLSSANLFRANLSAANLKGTNFSNANLRDADLSRADLSGANLNDADLSGTNLSEAILITSHLVMARLINATLDKALLTGAWLWETQRAGWSIKGIFCESAYWDEEAKEKTEYAPGEFERLFADKTKICLFYKDGISPLEIVTLPALIQHLANSYPDCNLRFVSIHEASGGAIVELAIEETENFTGKQIKELQAALQTEAQGKVEYQRKALIERETRLQLEGKVEQLDSFVDKLLLRQGNTFNNYGQAAAFGENPLAHHNTFNQLVNHFNQSIDLSALAKELSELRQAITDKQDSSPQADIALVKVAEAEIAATEKDTPKVIEHLKSAGKWTMDFAKELGKDVVVAAIKQSMGMP